MVLSLNNIRNKNLDFSEIIYIFTYNSKPYDIYRYEKNCEYNDDPFFRYTDEERRNMTQEQYCALIREHNEYAEKQFGKLNEQKPPKFNTVEELLEYYDAIPFEEAVNNMNKLFNQ